MQICVIAKEPRPGFSKTRLTPPCSPTDAAAIAEAALADTLEVVGRTPARRRVVALDGAPGRWLPAGFDVIAQVGGGLGDRLDGAFASCFAARPDDPVVLIGMDTPQVTPSNLTAAGEHLAAGTDAVLGLASDGGYWLIGLRSPVPGAFSGVPMSTSDTGRAQRSQLEQLGCSVELVDTLADVDSFADAVQVAAQQGRGSFTSAVRRVERELAMESRHDTAP
jgi:hypothetical protein